MAYVNPVGQQFQQPETLRQENPNKMQEMMLLAQAVQPQTSQPRQQSQGGGGVGGMGSSLIGKFMGGGGGGVAAGGAPATGAISDFGAAGTGSISGGSIVGGEAAGGTSSGGLMSSIGSWGPWAALAAAIIGNEQQAVDKGDRRSGSDYWQDLATGEVLQQDITDRWGPKVFGDNQYGFGGDTLAGVQLSQGDFSDAWKTFKDQSTLAKLLGRDSDKDWRDYT